MGCHRRLNGHIEDMYTGHVLVTAFGRREETTAVFERHNGAVIHAGTKAQFLSSLIQPALTFLQGSHGDLLASDGAYARLYDAQFAAPVAARS